MKILKILAVAISALAMPAIAPVTASAQVEQLSAEINVIPDKVTKTDDGIRIAFCLIGIPSTSQRIDGIDLHIGTKLVKATDVDGIDFERYFQFEDTGVVVIEVDFPFQGTLPKTATVTLHTDKGDIEAPARQ